MYTYINVNTLSAYHIKKLYRIFYAYTASRYPLVKDFWAPAEV